MISRRGGRALVVSIVSIGAFVVPVSFSGALQSTVNANENARTLVLSLPGPFNGCTFLDTGANPTTGAILDLVRPSAFITNANGVLAGENGAIASAELTSLQPETVRYTLSADKVWSNGLPFTGNDLVTWWQRAKSLASVTSDGYRAIKTLNVSSDGLVVTAVFAKPYADWNLLFRDVEARGTSLGCGIANLTTRPSLGPYRVTSATPSRVVLVMNRQWPLDANRFGRVVISDATTLPTSATTIFADYSRGVNRAQVQTISSYPTMLSRIASSNSIEELTFAPRRPSTANLAVRKALSWSITRQQLVNQLFGAVTYSTSVAASAVYSQGQAQYPGTSGTGPPNQPTTTTSPLPTTVDGLSDCVTCAVATLRDEGLRRTSAGWLNSAGTPLSIRLAVGSSALDQAVAKIIASDWTAIGIATVKVNVRGEAATALAAATNSVDAAVFSRPTLSAPSYAARSWVGAPYPNTFPSGVRIPAITALFNQATAIFNPVTASATWLRIDQIIMTHYWVRPLFAAPSLAVWSSSLATVLNTFSVPGFVDQLPTWSITSVPPQS